jgi:DNA mismatch endonuclease, patch repair protein
MEPGACSKSKFANRAASIGYGRVQSFIRHHGIVGWRRHRPVFGKPDFVFPAAKVAVFVDGCFWHGCPKHSTMPANNRAFWKERMAANKARDRRVNRTLRRDRWRVVRIWEHELKHPDDVLARLVAALTAPTQALVRRALGPARRQSGKVFYSSPKSLLCGRLILIGFNPGGAPTSRRECRIADNVDSWPGIAKNHYHSEKWRAGGKRFSVLRERVQALFKKLNFCLDDTFTSNLWFPRSCEASGLRPDDHLQQATREVWTCFLARCPARKIHCIGVNTAKRFLRLMEATEVRPRLIDTIHPRARVFLASPKIASKTYRIAAIPHLSRFDVASKSNLPRKLAKHLNGI